MAFLIEYRPLLVCFERIIGFFCALVFRVTQMHLVQASFERYDMAQKRPIFSIKNCTSPKRGLYSV